MTFFSVAYIDIITISDPIENNMKFQEIVASFGSTFQSERTKFVLHAC